MMLSDEARIETVSELKRILSGRRIPDHLRQGAEALVARLTQPVRLTVFGLPGSGKSTLANLLLGRQVLTPGARLPTVQVTWGESPKASCTMRDGSTVVLDRIDPAEIAARSPIFVQAELPLPALGKISVMEVVAKTADDLRRAIRWASSRTDIAIWCTQRFNSPEQVLWAAAPDDMKDHGFLVVTKADEALAHGALEATLAAIEDHAGEEFNRILPVATLDAIAARREDGRIDKDRLTRSGGRALIAAILREVDLGRRAALDQAGILLRQYGGSASVAENPAAAAAPEPEVAAAEPAPAASGIDVAEPAAAPPAAPAPGLSAAARAAYQHAIGRLSQHGRAAVDGVGADDAIDPGRLMQETVDSVQWLSDYLSDKAGEDAASARIRDAAYDAADLLQLMRMENDANAVKESVSIVIQLKREMEAALAA